MKQYKATIWAHWLNAKHSFYVEAATLEAAIRAADEYNVAEHDEGILLSVVQIS